MERSPLAKRSKIRGSLRARAFVLDGDERLAVGAADGHGDRARCRACARWGRGCRRRAASAWRSPSTHTSRSITGSSARSASRTGSRCSGAAASSRASASRSSSSSESRSAPCLEVGDRRRVGAVLGQVGGVPAQRGQRRAQLVRGVADEAVLGFAGPLERGEHRVERVRELAHLVVDRRLREPLRGVAGARDRPRAAGQPRQRPQRAAGEQRRQRGREHRGDQRAQGDQRPGAVQRVLDPGQVGGHDHRAARGRALPELPERRGVDAQRVGPEPRRRRTAAGGRAAPARRPAARARRARSTARRSARTGRRPGRAALPPPARPVRSARPARWR